MPVHLRSTAGLNTNELPVIPLGKILPSSPHAVFASLPTIADVIAYEEKDDGKNDGEEKKEKEVKGDIGGIGGKRKKTEKAGKKKHFSTQMEGGYPRFVNPRLTQQLESVLARKQISHKRSVRLLSSLQRAHDLYAYMPPESKPDIHTEGSLYWLSFINETPFAARAQEFLQHTGAMVFSREAEDLLLVRGELAQRHPEEYLPEKSEDACSKVLASLAKELGLKTQENIFLSRCGMSALFGAYQAVAKVQQAKGRRIWIQLGWLYVDTIQILKKFSQSEEEYIYLPDALDLTLLKKVLIQHSGQTAAIVTEAPSNPLLCTPDIPALAQICKDTGTALILDPSLSGINNVDALAYCDVLISSLTKYHGWSGDLIMGFAALNPRSRFHNELSKILKEYIDPAYNRDIERLAYLLEEYPTIVEQINQNTMRFAEFLSEHRRIKKIHWAYSSTTRENYAKIAKGPESPGGVLSFVLDMPLADFYDRVAMPKGPSFGTAFSILCPFLYLAHYDLIKTKAGQKYLKQNGLDPELLRLSVGIEPIEKLRAAFTQALS